MLRTLLVTVALFAALAPAASAFDDPPCDRTWGGTTGNFGDGSKWVGGTAPNGNERACLPNGAYTVTLTGSAGVKGVTIGTGVTLVTNENQYIDARSGGGIINRGTITMNNGSSLYGPFDNSGTIQDAGTIATRPNLIGAMNNSGTLKANTGLELSLNGETFASTGTLTTANDTSFLYAHTYNRVDAALGGTVSGPGNFSLTGATVRLKTLNVTGTSPHLSDDSLDASAGSGKVEVNGYVDLVANIAAGATVNVLTRDANSQGYLRMNGDFTNAGTINLDSLNKDVQAHIGPNNNSPRLTNTGTLHFLATTSNERELAVAVTNSGTFTVDAGATVVENFGDFATSGTVTINGNYRIGVYATAWKQTAGTVTVNGNLTVRSGTATHAGGTITGAVDVNNSASFDPSGPGTAAFRISGYANLVGDVNAATTVTLESNNFTFSQVTMDTAHTMAGTLRLTSTGTFAQDTTFTSTNGSRLTITGRTDLQAGVGGIRHLNLPLTVAAAGTLALEPLAKVYVNGNGSTYTHTLAGTVTVPAGASLLWRVATQTITQTAGTITAAGSFDVEGNTFVHQGGIVVGRIQLASSNVRGRLDASGPGTAAYFTTGAVDLIADINADATLVAGTSSEGVAVYVTGNFSNYGTIQIGEVNSAWGAQLADDQNANSLDNRGTLTAVTGGDRGLNVKLINHGTLAINANTSGVTTRNDVAVPLITNAGGTVAVTTASLTSWGGYVQSSGTTTLTDASLGSPRNPATIDIQGGRLKGNGTLLGPVQNAGTIEATKTLAINDVVDQIVRVGASYTQTATGRLAVGVRSASDFGQVTVQGPATLAGALDVSLAAGYTPPVGTHFRVVQSETRSGTFADATGVRSFNVAYDGTGAELVGRTPPPPSGEITLSGGSVLENAGPLKFTATLSKASTDPVTVDWTTEDDTAIAPDDYTASSGTLIIPAGALTGTISVPVTNDAVVEGSKEFLVRLRHPVNATLDVPTAVGRIDPDDVGILSVSPTRLGDDGPATVTVIGGGFTPGTTLKLSRSGSGERTGAQTGDPALQSKLVARFDMRGASAGAWDLTLHTPGGATVTRPVTVEHQQPALDAVLSVPRSLRYGWVGRAVLSIRNSGGTDVGMEAIRFAGTDLELRPVGASTFSGTHLALGGDDLGDAAVIPPFTTRTVTVEVRSTTTVGHAPMGIDAEIFPSGYMSQIITGSDPDPGTGSISGHVTDASGHPVRALLVTAFAGGDSTSARTDGSGAYSLTPLKPGTYAVSAADARGSAVVNEDARSVDLKTGVTDVSGAAAGDAIVALMRDGHQVASVKADAVGGFRFRVLSPGGYQLVADSPSKGRASQPLTVVSGVPQAGLALAFGGRLLTVHTIAGAKVRAWPAGEDELPSERVATGGTATFSGMGAGALTVEARATGKAPARTTTSANDVTVTPGTAATLTGLVTAGGAPVARAQVFAGGSVATTGADGRYTISDLAPGAVDVWVLAGGYAPAVKRGASGTADVAVIFTGSTIPVHVSDGHGGEALGTLVRAVDPATGVVVASGVTAGSDRVAPLGPLPAGTYRIEGGGATLTVGTSAPAKSAARRDTTLPGGDPAVLPDPETDPAYQDYTDPFSGLPAPQLNRKDRLGWDQVFTDYLGPCPTADAIYDLIQVKQKIKIHAFDAWVDAWSAAGELGSADVGLYLSKAALLAANSIAAVRLFGQAPPGVSAAALSILQNATNYIGTMRASNMGQLDPLKAADYASYFKDAMDSMGGLVDEADGATSATAYLSTAFNVIRGMVELSDEVRQFPADVAERGNNYLMAQELYNRTIRDINDLLNQYTEAKKHCPEQVKPKPKAPVTSGGSIENITANDPNELLGPEGVGVQGWIPRSQGLGYSIRFENLGPGSTIPPGQQPASAPATTVKVVTTLSSALDIDQVTLGGIGWGAVEIPVPAGVVTYHKDVPQSDGDIVRIDGSLNKSTRTITWTLKTIDPATGDVDGSPTAGFLPPEDGSHRGQGHVDYVAGTPSGAAQGASITAKATITFDVNAPIDTNTHTNTVDGAKPVSTLTVGNAACNGQIALTRAGTDDGSGVAGYELEVSADKGDWTAVTDDTFTGLPGHDYAFRLNARDAVGNAEAKAATGVTRSVPVCDTTPPRTTATAPAGAVDGWYSGPVDVKLDAVDAPGGSGVKTLRYAGSSVSAASATTHMGAEGLTDLVFSAVDTAGNVEPDAHLPVGIDTTAPTVTATDGATYGLGQPVAPDVVCADAGVGIATCEFPATLDTGAAGAHTFSVHATDKFGHATDVTRGYIVSAPQVSPGPPAVTPVPPAAAPVFGKAPVKLKLGKVTRTSVVVTLTSGEKFAFTGKATLFTPGKKGKAQSKVASFALGKPAKLTLKLKSKLRAGKKVKLVLRLDLKAGAAKKTVDLAVTLKAF